MAEKPSKEILQHFIEYFPAAIAMFDRNMRYLSYSRRWITDYNLGDRDLCGLSHYEIFPEIPERWKEVHRRALAGEVLQKKDDRFERDDGSVQWLCWEVKPWYDNAGDIGGILIYSEDITERKTYEIALQKSEERFHLAVRAAQEGVWDWNTETDEVWYSPRYKEMLGYSEEEIENHLSAWQRLVHPDDKEPSLKIIEAVKRGEQDYKIEFRIRHKDGHYLDILSQGYPIRREPDGKVARIVGTHFDLTELKQNERNLKFSEERQRLALDAARMGSYHWNVTTGKIIWSDEYRKIFGLPPDISASYDKWVKSILPEDREAFDKALCNSMEKRCDFDSEYRTLWPDGTVHWISAKGRFFYGVDGSPQRMEGVVSDITERKHVVDLLLRSEERFRLAMEASNDGIWDYNVITSETYYSPAYTAMLGYEPSELPAHINSWMDLIHPDDKAAALKMNLDCIENRCADFVVEFRMKSKTGGWRWILGRGKAVSRDKNGLATRIIGTHTDISDLKQAQDALVDSEKLFRTTFMNSPVALSLMRLEDRLCIDINQAEVDMFGYSRDECVGKLRNPVLWDDMNDRENFISNLLQNGREKNECVRLRHKDGRLIIASVSATLLNLKGARHVLYASEDITVRKQAEEQRKQLAKAESLNRMASAIAHNFNNQLYVVIGNLELLITSIPLGSDGHTRLTDAMVASHKAADISRMMLTYLGQSPGKMEMQDLSETCHKAILMAQASIPKNVSLNLEIPSPGPTINANSSQLCQIIDNLLTNAWESITDQQGAITVSVKTVSAKDISISNRFPVGWQPKESIYTCLEVKDTGCGIPKENIDKIFDPFFTTRFTGRGLGLPVVMGILKTHCGAITVENRIGGGSAFRIYLSLAFKTTSVAIDKLAPEASVPSGGVILLIDDQDQVRNMTKMMLSRLGFSVLEAADGIQAVDIFLQQKEKITCVITDLTMPRMNGWELLAELRKISPDIPVILSSGYDESQVMAESEYSERPSAFLGKPYRLQEISDTIRHTLENKK